MYSNTLPDMQRLLNQNGQNIQLAPRWVMQFFLLSYRLNIAKFYDFSLSHSIRLLFSSKDPEPLFVFEDATTLGYGLSAGPLNFEGTKFVVARLAKFHAASLYLDRDVSEKLLFYDNLARYYFVFAGQRSDLLSKWSLQSSISRCN
jgi:hypothetical protein